MEAGVMKSARKISTNCAIYCLVFAAAAIFTIQFNAAHRGVVSDPLTVTPATHPSVTPRATTRGHLQDARPEVDEHAGTAEAANQPLRPASGFGTDVLAAMHPLMTVPPRPGLRP